jgi:hypothetical protein
MALMNQLESGWKYGGGGPAHLDPPNFFGAPSLTSSSTSGPYFNNGQATNKPSRDAALAPFLGFPSKADIPDPYEAYDIENFQLPDGFKGSRPYMKYIILKQVSTADEYPFREMAPFQRNDSTQEIVWDVWMFNNHMLGRTPEESVSRLLTMNQTQSREAMVRFGIALMLEHGFYNTPKGRENYRRNMDQISAATSTTLAHGAMYACYNAKYTDPYQKYRSQQSRNLLQMGQLFREEIDNWAIIQKSEDGWKIIYDKCKQTLIQRNGKPGNYTVVPAGVKKYLAGRPENKYFLYNGIPGGENTNLMPHEGALKESVGYRIGEHQPSDDIAIREKTIGGFFHMLPHHLENVPDDEFKISMMDTDIYCEDRDDYYTMKYKDAVTKLGLFNFNEKDGPITDIGKQFFASVDSKLTWGSYFHKAGIHDKLVRQIQRLTSDAQTELLNIMDPRHIPTSVAPSSGPSTAAPRPPPPPGGMSELERLLRAYVFASPVEISKLFDELTHLIHTSTAKDFIKKDLKNFIILLRDCDVSGDLLVQFKEVLDQTPLNSNSLIGLDVLDFYVIKLAYYIEKEDEKSALSRLTGAKTRLEECFSSKEFADLKDNETKAYEYRVSKNKESPHWLMQEEDARYINPVDLLLVPFGDKRCELKSDSLAFTLVNDRLVLFGMTDEQFLFHKTQVSTSGHILINTHTHKSAIHEVLSKDNNSRFSRLQFSATISAVFKVFEDAVLGKTDHDTKSLISAIKSVCPLKHPVKGSSDLYEREIQQVITVGPMKTLVCQFRLDTVINALKDVLLAFIVHKTDGVIKDKVNQVLLLFTRHFTQIRDSSHQPVSAESSIYGISSVSTFDEYTKFIGSGPDKETKKKEWCEIENEAVQEVKKLVHELAVGPKADLVKDAFSMFGNSFIDRYKLYMVVKPKDPDGEEKWEYCVRGTVRLYVSGDYTCASSFEQEYLTVFVKGRIKTPIFETVMLDWISANHPAIVVASTKLKVGLGQKLLSVNSNGLNRGLYDLTTLTLNSGSFDMLRNAIFGKTSTIAKVVNISGLVVGNYNDIQQTMLGVLFDIVTRKDQSPMLVLLDTFVDPGLDHTCMFPVTSESAGTLNEVFGAFLSSTPKERVDGKKQFVSIVCGLCENILESTNAIGPTSVYKNKPTSSSSSVKHTSGGGGFLTRININDMFKDWVIEDSRLVVFGLAYNLYAFFSILGFRPSKRYMMGSMVHMMGYGEAAKTYYGFADFQLADNVAQKVHYGHFTMYAKTVVLRPDMIVRGDNIVVKDYNGGNGTRVWDPLNEDHVDAYRSNELENDVFLAAVLPNWTLDATQFMDITGRFSDRLMPNLESKRATDYGPMARILSNLWGWRSVASPVNREHFSTISPKFNTIVFQEHQMLYSHSSKRFDKAIIEKGHWGGKVYPGCGEVRRGYGMYFKNVDYDHTRQIVISAS